MDGQLLRWLYQRLLHDPASAHTRDCVYSDGLIVLIYFFASLSERSVLWASDRRNWPLWCRRLKLPSRSQIHKRLRSDSIRQLIDQLNDQLLSQLPLANQKIVDGKPLIVGGFSHDPDARRGKVPDGWARGYKLHVLIDACVGVIQAFALTPLCAGESTVLRQQLIGATDLRDAILRADANYDSSENYRAVAQAGGRLMAPRRRAGGAIGHRPQHPDRLAAIGQLESSAGARATHRRARNRVEQALALLTNLPFGLAPLPNFVRRLRRVRQWVTAKIVLYHLYLLLRQTRVPKT